MSRKALIITIAVFFVLGLLCARGLQRIEELSSGSYSVSGESLAAGELRYRRIVCLAPSITETVFALGGGDRVVGVGDFTFWPAKAKELPKVGGFIDPNFERLLSLRPDLVIVQGRQDKVADFCRRQGIDFLRIERNDLPGVFEGIRDIGRKLGLEPRAWELEAELRRGLERISLEVSGRPRARVFLAIGRTAGTLSQLMTAGGASYLSQLVDVAGGDNIFADLKRDYPMISKESLVVRDPEVIIEAHPGEQLSEEARKAFLTDWRALPGVNAVREGRIVVLTQDHLLIAGPRLVESAQCLAEAIHPEVFAK